MEAQPKLLFLVTEDWYFCSHRLALARAAQAAGFRVVVATRVKAHAQLIEDAGLELHAIDMRRSSKHPLRELAAVRELCSLYRRVQPDIVHHVGMKPVVYGSVAARVARVPWVVNALAGLGYVFTSEQRMARRLRPFLKTALKSLLGRCNGLVIVQNPEDRQAVESLRVAPERIVLVPGSGVDTIMFCPTAEPSGPPVFCMVSRMLWDKGVGEVVAAAARAKRVRPDIRVRLVGDPDAENPAAISLEQLRRWNAEGTVQWLGQQDDMPGVWAQSHVALLPSYREGLPKSLVEAAACGRPIITTDVPGCRDIVEHGVNGLLVAPRDGDALCEAMLTLADDGALRTRMGQAGRRRVVDRFSEAHVIAATMALYARLTNRCTL